jgi:hypothetical protein
MNLFASGTEKIPSIMSQAFNNVSRAVLQISYAFSSTLYGESEERKKQNWDDE